MFGHHYAHLQENKTYVTACGVLRWFCWMWLVAVVRRCLVGCEHRYQPHPAEPAQHTTCSNIMMSETCWEIVKNKYLTVASCWFSLSLHNLLTMHGHRNPKFGDTYIHIYPVPSMALRQTLGGGGLFLVTQRPWIFFICRHVLSYIRTKLAASLAKRAGYFLQNHCPCNVLGPAVSHLRRWLICAQLWTW